MEASKESPISNSKILVTSVQFRVSAGRLADDIKVVIGCSIQSTGPTSAGIPLRDKRAQ